LHPVRYAIFASASRSARCWKGLTPPAGEGHIVAMMFGLTPMPGAIGTVTAQDGDRYRVFVVLEGPMGGAGPTVPVTVGTHGPRDSLRIEQPPLPTRGTRGLVVFPRGDWRNAVWVCSIEGPEQDAVASSAAQQNVAYASRWSGYAHMQDEGGNQVSIWPDGSTMTVGAAPAPTRHVVASGQQRAVQPFPTGSRTKVAASPKPFALAHASGAEVQVTAAGAVSASAAPGQGVTLVANGGTVEIDASGKVLVSSPGEVDVLAPAIRFGAALTDTLRGLCTSAFATWAENHVHTDPQGGNTGPPTTAPGGGSVTSVVTAE
jgi:hypothetical protein